MAGIATNLVKRCKIANKKIDFYQTRTIIFRLLVYWDEAGTKSSISVIGIATTRISNFVPQQLMLEA